jgi:hypothetical protein
VNLGDLRRRLAHLAGAVAPPENRIAPDLLAGFKVVWQARWPEKTETDWRRRTLGVIDKVMAMNSEERATLLAKLDAKITAAKGEANKWT